MEPPSPWRRALGGVIVGAACVFAWTGWRGHVADQPAPAEFAGSGFVHVLLVGEPVVARAGEARADKTGKAAQSSVAGAWPAVASLSHADVGVRLDAVLALASEGTEAAAVALAPVAVGDVDASVREEAVSALGEIGGAVSLHALAQALNDRDAEVRRAAVEAFADIGGDESARALVPVLKDADASLRAEAVDALGDIGGETARRLLLDAAKDEDRAVREAAAEYLADALH